MTVMPFHKLKIWEKGMRLAQAIYQLTRNFPKEEMFGLTSQMRRAAVSIPSNIAEGSQRTSDKDFANFILIAKGSLAELETQLLLSSELHYLTKEEMMKVRLAIDELSKMLRSFHSKLIASR